MEDTIFGELTVQAHSEGINRLVAGAIIVRDNSVLLLRRKEDDFMGGIYELPSGEAEEGESLESALKREVKEETGLSAVKIMKFAGSFDYVSARGKKTRQFNFLVATDDAPVIISKEHDNYAWSPVDELNRYNITGSVREMLENLRHSSNPPIDNSGFR